MQKLVRKITYKLSHEWNTNLLYALQRDFGLMSGLNSC